MAQAPPGLPSPAIRDDGKVVVRFQHTGGAPILKQQKYKLAADARFSTVITLLKQKLGLKAEDALVCFCSRTLAHTAHRSAAAHTAACESFAVPLLQQRVRTASR